MTISINIGLGVKSRGKFEKPQTLAFQVKILKIRAILYNWASTDRLEIVLSSYGPQRAENTPG